MQNVAIPPKHAVSNVVGKSTIHLARVYSQRKRKFDEYSIWACDYFVSRDGRDAEMHCKYIRE